MSEVVLLYPVHLEEALCSKGLSHQGGRDSLPDAFLRESQPYTWLINPPSPLSHHLRSQTISPEAWWQVIAKIIT
jgi:hypothetical protein